MSSDMNRQALTEYRRILEPAIENRIVFHPGTQRNRQERVSTLLLGNEDGNEEQKLDDDDDDHF